MFIIDTNNNMCNQGELVYLQDFHEFTSYPHKNSDITILVGYINIGFDSETNQATQIWGVHHNFNWKKQLLNIPESIKAKISLDMDIESGDSFRIKQADEWETFYDHSGGWVRFGSKESINSNNFVEFFTDTIAEIDQNGNLVALWLKPIIR